MADISQIKTPSGDTYNIKDETARSSISNLAPKHSPTFTGVPTAPTADASANDTQIATTAFVHSVMSAADAMVFKGTIGTGGTVTSLPATHSVGWTYKVITAGTYAGKVCEVGDMIICVTAGTTASNDHWTVVQSNIDGAVTGPSSAVDARVAVFNGTSGKLIKDSGFTIGKSVPSDAVFTDNDTKNTAGSTDTSDKIYIVGAKTQAANPQTYSQDTAYVGTDGCLYSGGNKVLTSHQDISGKKNTQSAVSDPTADGTAVEFISSISQDAQGVITPAKKTVSTMTGATSDANGAAGLVPAPASGNRAQFLKGDGTWATPTNTTYQFDGTYNASTNKAATVSTVTNAIAALDGNLNSTTPGSGKTLTAFSETDGVVSATFGDISITKSQVSDFPTSMTPASHTHGNIQNSGALQTTDVAIASGDKLVVTDASNSNKIARTSVSFDGSTATKALTQKGTFETFLTSHQDISGKKNTQSAVSDPTASGTSVTFIATISQDAQGVITPTKKTVSTMTAASSSAAGAAGLVPQPASGKQGAFLRGDATWATPTDTKNTAGSTDSSSKLFLIGATSQAANPQTYSQDTAYVGTDGCLYSDSKKVITGVTFTVADDVLTISVS